MSQIPGFVHNSTIKKKLYVCGFVLLEQGSILCILYFYVMCIVIKVQLSWYTNNSSQDEINA